MDTDALIESLAGDVRPTPQGALARRIGLGAGLGAAGALALVLFVIGVNPHLAGALRLPAFWLKLAYSASIGALAIAAAADLARPDSLPLRRLPLALAAPVLVMAGAAAVTLALSPESDWAALWLGQSWRKCPWFILSLAAPIYLGLLWSFRRLAPTRLRSAGAAAGLAAGGIAASLYCLHCPEMSPLFVLCWYSLGVAAAAGIGAVIGPLALRW